MYLRLPDICKKLVEAVANHYKQRGERFATQFEERHPYYIYSVVAFPLPGSAAGLGGQGVEAG